MSQCAKVSRLGLGCQVVIAVSGETGYVKGRAEYVDSATQYYIHYKAADGRAVTAWFDEGDLQIQTEV